MSLNYKSFFQKIDDVRKQEINKIVFDILGIPCPQEEIIEKLTFSIVQHSN